MLEMVLGAEASRKVEVGDSGKAPERAVQGCIALRRVVEEGGSAEVGLPAAVFVVVGRGVVAGRVIGAK